MFKVSYQRVSRDFSFLFIYIEIESEQKQFDDCFSDI